MKQTGLIVLIALYWLNPTLTIAQDNDTYDFFIKFTSLCNSGDFINAEKCMLSVLNSKEPPVDDYIVAAYNNLGLIKKNLGLFNEAIEYYNRAESLILKNHQTSLNLADVYLNKSRIYTFRKSYLNAIEYLDKSIRIYLKINNPDYNLYRRISTAYLNTGIIYYQINDYKTAMLFLDKSSELKLKYDLPEKAFVYLNMAKTFTKIGNRVKAEEYFNKSASHFKTEFGESNYRIAELYFDYGLFLQAIGRNFDADAVHQKALSICLLNYGEKHPLISKSYKNLGDNYMLQADYQTALMYYQKSLISVVEDFNDPDIFTNPSIDSSLFDIQMLEDLKNKSQALELYSDEQDDPAMKLKTLGMSLETIELALKLINNIRNNYPTEESRIYLAENEKETYIFATHVASRFYSLSGDKSKGYKIYEIAQKAKAAILRDEITGNELLYSEAMPDSLREKQNRLSANIGAYNNLILTESRLVKPDSSKISLWKDALFDMNRENEKVAAEIGQVYPQYYELLRKTEPLPVKMIQKKLKNDETIVDYLLSNQYSGGKRKLYIFLITRHTLEFRETELDSLFIINARILHKTSNPELSAGKHENNYAFYTGALNYMYTNLIEPVEDSFSGDRLIIIPDEEIGWFPFDALLKSKPETGQSDYEALKYLIQDYTFSYGYSSSLIFNEGSRSFKKPEVFAFSPDYGDSTVPGKAADTLSGAVNEIKSVYRWFRGKMFTGDQATKSNFLLAMHNQAIFHLAMHSMSDSLNSRFSYMLFDTRNVTPEEGRLFNYEISLGRIKSPMVVLSACNSGSGTLYYGEGLMSLARSFLLAGASSVIKTAWEVNDEASSAIMTRFYYHLSEGKEKDEALRLAKLEYLKESPPYLTNPYFWATYEVLGDNAPVARNNSWTVLIVISMIFIAGGGLLIYFRRRRIFSAPSL